MQVLDCCCAPLLDCTLRGLSTLSPQHLGDPCLIVLSINRQAAGSSDAAAGPADGVLQLCSKPLQRKDSIPTSRSASNRDSSRASRSSSTKNGSSVRSHLHSIKTEWTCHLTSMIHIR
jgi:hypothetical protein